MQARPLNLLECVGGRRWCTCERAGIKDAPLFSQFLCATNCDKLSDRDTTGPAALGRYPVWLLDL